MNLKILSIIGLMFVSCYVYADDSYNISLIDKIKFNKKYLGISYNYNFLANKINTSVENGYDTTKSPKSTIAGGVFFGVHLNKNIDTQISFDYGKMSIKNALVPSQAFLESAGTINPSVITVLKRAYANLTYEYYKIGLDTNYSFNSENKLSPYVGAGLGISFNRTSDYTLRPVNLPALTNSTGSHKTSTNFTYNLALGIKYKIRPKKEFRIFYKFQDMGKIKNSLFSVVFNNNQVISVPDIRKSRIKLHSFGIAYVVNL